MNRVVRSVWIAAGTVTAVAVSIFVGCQQMGMNGKTTSATSVHSSSTIAAGKYLVMVGGCNDCHTPGYMQMGRQVPESEWLIGLPVGFKGPWGTTYPSNLRQFVSKTPADTFVKVLRQRNARPPMPWESIHAMGDEDLLSMYAYIKSLPVKGDPIPEFVPPGTEPKTPYIIFEPVLPKATDAGAKGNQPG